MSGLNSTGYSDRKTFFPGERVNKIQNNFFSLVETMSGLNSTGYNDRKWAFPGGGIRSKKNYTP